MDATVAAWRKQQRARLTALRATVAPEQRAAAARSIAAGLDRAVAALAVRTIGLFWPIEGEISLLPWGRAIAEQRGAELCLPVVVTPKAPLEYWRWTPGEAMQPGFWNIPQPSRREVVLPDLMLAPVLGFDAANYRLGYGGGYFDRTLATRQPRPFVIGVGYDFGALETIFPQPHDIPLDGVLTEQRNTLPHEWSDDAN